MSYSTTVSIKNTTPSLLPEENLRRSKIGGGSRVGVTPVKDSMVFF